MVNLTGSVTKTLGAGRGGNLRQDRGGRIIVTGKRIIFASVGKEGALQHKGGEKRITID